MTFRVVLEIWANPCHTRRRTNGTVKHRQSEQYGGDLRNLWADAGHKSQYSTWLTNGGRRLSRGAKLARSVAVIAPLRDGRVRTDGPGGAIEDSDCVEVEVLGSRPMCALVGAHVFTTRADRQKRVAIKKNDP
jgi:hypothetical protein